MSKKLFVETLGCQMNERDTEHMIAELKKHKDYTKTDNYQDADLILINTCSVREKPVSKLFSELGTFNKNKKPDAKIGVCGCTASHLGEDIIKRAPYVDFVIGARNVSKIVEAVDTKGMVAIDINYDDTAYSFADFRPSKLKSGINISLGCDKQCSFCIVPATRGKEVSIAPDVIINEIQKCVDDGSKEVMLLGQNVNNYGTSLGNNYGFVNLLQDISKIEKLERIRFTSPHPLHMDDEFIEEFVSNDKISKFIHMPLQSGSTKILKDMKRGYTKKWFINRALKIRKLIPNVRISTDIIVGFPGETREDFEDTLDVMRQVKFDQVFNFKYSPRPDTTALLLDNEVDGVESSARLQQVIDLHKNYQDELMPQYIGECMQVYFERFDKDKNEIIGFSDNFCQVVCSGDESMVGKMLNVNIVSSSRTILHGNIEDKA